MEHKHKRVVRAVYKCVFRTVDSACEWTTVWAVMSNDSHSPVKSASRQNEVNRLSCMSKCHATFVDHWECDQSGRGGSGYEAAVEDQ